MSNTKLSILLLVALLAINTFAHGLEGAHKCTHGQQENPESEVMDIEEDFNPETNDHSGRTLADYSDMRFYGNYDLLADATEVNRNYFQNDLIPPILDYFSKALKNKYPVVGLWKTTATSVCGMSTPAILKTGVTADFVLFVETDTSDDYVANTYTCTRASGTNRPLSGKTTISTAFMSYTSDVLKHEKSMICIMHELIHALGFSTSLYPKFINSVTGKTLTGHILYETVDDVTSLILNVEPLTTRLRQHFGCSTLKGAYMENSGSSATAGSHFERKIFSFEVMTSGLIYQQQLSQFTLALLEGSGWYAPDYAYADGFWWGQGQGCNFINGTCSASQYDEFCSASTRSCSNPGRGGGSCTADTRADGCKFVIPSVNYDCDNVNADDYARLPALQAFGRDKNSKCFTGTLASSSSAGSSTSFCFKHTCTGSGSTTQLTLQVGTKSVVCTAEGKKTVSGYAGAIDCPDPLTFCSTVGAKTCPRNCMGRGTCVSGVCQCNVGATGKDCALNL